MMANHCKTRNLPATLLTTTICTTAIILFPAIFLLNSQTTEELKSRWLVKKTSPLLKLQVENYSYSNYEKECRQLNCSAITGGDKARFPDLNFEAKRDAFMDLRRILLVIQFNVPHYGAASKMYAIYARLFGRVVFCGPERNESTFWPNKAETRRKKPLISLPENVTFYAMGEQSKVMGENGYICIDRVMQDYDDDKAFPFDGVMLTGDDVVLNYWTWQINGKSLSKNWLMSPQSPFITFDIDRVYYCKGYDKNPELDCFSWLGDWSWHKSFRHETVGFYGALEDLAKNGSDDANFWQQFMTNLTRTTSGAKRRLYQGYSDVFYIAKQYLPIIRPIFRMMSKNKLFLEFAVPSAIRAISGNEDLQFIDSRGHDWRNGIYRNRDMADVYRTYEFEMFHPFKLTLAFSNETNRYEPTRRSDWSKTSDPTANCVYCYLRNLSLNYAKNVIN